MCECYGWRHCLHQCGSGFAFEHAIGSQNFQGIPILIPMTILIRIQIRNIRRTLWHEKVSRVQMKMTRSFYPNFTFTMTYFHFFQLERNGLITVAYFDLFLTYMRILMLFATVPEKIMVFELYNTAVKILPGVPIINNATLHSIA